MTETPRGQRHDRTALILYGSETGNSQDVAEELGRVAERLRFVTRVREMELVEINQLLKYTFVIFAVSTTGQGEFPKNARKFWKSLLRKRLPPGCLDHVSFTTFGLGDSSYPKFNWSARKLHKRLEQLGAKEIYPRGEADEEDPEGIDGTFLPWSIDLGKHLLSSYPLPEGVTPIPADTLLPPKLTLELLDDPDSTDPLSGGTQELSKMGFEQQELSTTSVTTASGTSGTSSPINATTASGTSEPRAMMLYEPPMDPQPSTPCEQLKDHLPGVEPTTDGKFPPADRLEIPEPTEVRLVGNKRITPDTHWQDVRELTFIMSDEFEYLPGETMTIYPKNFPEDVQALIDLMDWNEVADKPLRLQPEYPDLYLDDYLVPSAPSLYPLPRTTLRQLLIHNLDITAIPKRHFFELIAHHTNDPLHKERLLEFTNPAYTDEFYDYATRPRRSILEVLQEFSTVKIPWKWATAFFPVIRGRAYSISSGGSLLKYPYEPNVIKVQILVALVKYRTVLKKVRQGLCSRYLASLPVGTELHVKFTIPDKFYEVAKDVPKLPVILIAPGTGLAPCRALLWDRAQLYLENKRAIGKAYLFYGGRNKDADFFYKEEWKYLQTQVFTAFSRDQKEKIYVQDVIRKEGKLVEHLIRKEGAIIYVCGSSGNMPKFVKEALLDVCTKFNPDGRSREFIEKAFAALEKDGHYIQETW